MKTDEQSDEYHASPGPADDEAIRRLIEIGDEAVGPIHLMEESKIDDGELEHMEGKAPEYFEKLARKAADAAAKQYLKRRVPVPPLVVSAQRAGEPDVPACERAAGDLIDDQLKQASLNWGAHQGDAIN